MRYNYSMKTKLTLLLCLCLILAACAPGAVTSAPSVSPTPDLKAVYTAAIERYFNAYIQADLDALLDSMDPAGPLYPDAAAIEQLRATAGQNALEGEALVTALTVLEESADAASVQATLAIRVDVAGDGNFEEQTGNLTCELKFSDGKWRIYNMEVR
jgi:hypothetical protein